MKSNLPPPYWDSTFQSWIRHLSLFGSYPVHQFAVLAYLVLLALAFPSRPWFHVSSGYVHPYCLSLIRVPTAIGSRVKAEQRGNGGMSEIDPTNRVKFNR